MTIAISSAGKAPMIARRMRERIEQLYDHSLGPLTALAGKYRKAIRRHLPDMRQRREFYDWMAEGPVEEANRKNKPERAEQALEQALQQRAEYRTEKEWGG